MQSPSYPAAYPADYAGCLALILGPPGSHIILQIQYMELEEPEDGVCLYDYIQVHALMAIDILPFYMIQVSNDLNTDVYIIQFSCPFEKKA